MRHQKKGHKLGRTASHRKATMAALSTALITHKRIETTQAKARALRAFIEPLVTRAKNDTTANRRQVFRHVRNKYAVTELFGDIAERVGDRPGGYTRIIKLGQRAGDSADMAVIELVDYNDVRPEGSGSGSGSKRTRRSRRTRRSKGTSRTQDTTTEETASEAAAAAATTAAAASTEDAATVADDTVDVTDAPVEATPAVEQDASTPVVQNSGDDPDGDDEGGDGGKPGTPPDPPPTPPGTGG